MIELNRNYNEKNLDTLRRMPDNFIDSIVTDPPYELNFMNKAWDNTGITYSVEFWAECLRVLKPGGYLLSFGGSRTYHRMACAIEDAGFEIRDMVEWLYGSGFPKSLDISKAIDKQAGAKRAVIAIDRTAVRVNSVRNHQAGQVAALGLKAEGSGVITAPATDQAKQWQGWGTALKPAHEPICMARKPLSEKTVADNVLRWGTGAINIDGSRVDTEDDITNHARGELAAISKGKFGDSIAQQTHKTNGQIQGRFPANLIHDGSPVVVDIFPQNAGAAAPVKRGMNGDSKGIYGDFASKGDDGETFYADKGSAARFFYCPKASTSERNKNCDNLENVLKAASNQAQAKVKRGSTITNNEDISGYNKVYETKNFHPTVKPIALMKYLVAMITPPGGICYDPFSGSGSTLVACAELEVPYIGSEMVQEHCEITKARLNTEVTKCNLQLTLF